MQERDEAIIKRYKMNEQEAESYIERIGMCTADGIDILEDEKIAIEQIRKSREKDNLL